MGYLIVKERRTEKIMYMSYMYDAPKDDSQIFEISEYKKLFSEDYPLKDFRIYYDLRDSFNEFSKEAGFLKEQKTALEEEDTVFLEEITEIEELRELLPEET